MLRWMVIFVIIFGGANTVRVCRTFKDYYNFSSKNCYNNIDTEINATQILRNWGCTVEEYKIYTADGYELLIVRAYKTIKYATPLIYGHGLYTNIRSLMMMGNLSLAYQILGAGRQIFFVNSRGTTDSQRHKEYTSNDIEYWDFSLHEMAVYDVPSVINLVLRVTGEKPVWLGYSMSSMVSISYTTQFPEEAKETLRGIITMGTSVYFKNLLHLLNVITPFSPLLKPILNVMWKGKVPLKDAFSELYELFARGPLEYYTLYNYIIAPFLGSNWDSISPEHFPVIALNLVDSSGRDVMDHYAQMISSGKFRPYHYGEAKNLKKYGTAEPPIYNVSKVSVPLAQFLGKGDILNTVKNGIRVNNEIRPELRCGITVAGDPLFTHLNFLDHKDQQALIGKALLQKIIDIETDNC